MYIFTFLLFLFLFLIKNLKSDQETLNTFLQQIEHQLILLSNYAENKKANTTSSNNNRKSSNSNNNEAINISN